MLPNLYGQSITLLVQSQGIGDVAMTGQGGNAL